MVRIVRPTTPLFTLKKKNEDDHNLNGRKSGSDDETSTVRTRLLYHDLQPPAFNLRKESLLFDENATTRQNNNVRRLWLACRQHLPRVVHGAREGFEPEPLSALYNMITVRIPAIVAGLVYYYNLFVGHPLIVDFGDGAFEIHPVIVASVLYMLLL